MLKEINPADILYLDIETVPQYGNYNELPENFKSLWEKKVQTFRVNPENSPGESYQRAGIYSEFGKVICISCGYFTHENKFRILSFSGHEEKILLQQFAGLVNKFCKQSQRKLCAHNGKEFDFPYLSRRMLINSIHIPDVLDTAGKKPWEVNHLDTMELWKFGDFKSYTSLALLAAVLDIPTPKDDIDGSRVGEVYWMENDLERIVSYCQKDVLTVAQIIRRFRGEDLIRTEDIIIVTNADDKK